MAVDLAVFPMKMEDREMGIEEAASASLQSMEHLVNMLSKEAASYNHHLHSSSDFTVSKLKRLISLFNRTGHARFRRGPSSVSPNPTSKSHFPIPKSLDSKAPIESPPEFSSTSSFMSTVTGDGSVSNPKLDLSLFPPPPPPPISSGKPPLSSKRKCHDSSSNPCHCSAKRGKSSRTKKTVRVPAISSKIADIPSDEFSWRKYGQKPIKGSPYPRGYYRCSTVKGCPARKHVERVRDDPTMLLVTYDGDHRHPQAAVTDPTLGFISHKS